MKSDEKTLIDGLFSRLREAEGQSAPRDAEAEAQINQHLVRQPAAPYYMAQVVLIQEAALKRLDQRVKELEAQVAQLQQSRPSSGGFLSGLFGGGARDEPAPSQSGRPTGWGETRFSIRRRRPGDMRQVWRPPRRPRLRGPAAFSAVRCRRPLGSLAGCWWPTCSPACSATASRRKSSR